MQFLGADAHFGTEPELKPIGKAGGGVTNTAAASTSQELARVIVIPGDYRFRMPVPY